MSTNGLKHRWVGYKLHWDASDSEVPLSCVLTSASLHDSQVAIRLATMTSRRVTACYELMDAGAITANGFRPTAKGWGTWC